MQKIFDANSLINELYDTIIISYPTLKTEVYDYKIGGVDGKTVTILEVTYVSPTKEQIQSISRTFSKVPW